MANSDEISSFLDKIDSLEDSLSGMCTLVHKDLEGNRGYSYALIESKEGYLIVSTNGPDISLTNDELYEISRQVIFPEKYPPTVPARALLDLLGSEDAYFLAKKEVLSQYRVVQESKSQDQQIEFSFLFAEFLDNVHEGIVPRLSKGLVKNSKDYELTVLEHLIGQIDEDRKFRDNMWIKKR